MTNFDEAVDIVARLLTDDPGWWNAYDDQNWSPEVTRNAAIDIVTDLHAANLIIGD